MSINIMKMLASALVISGAPLASSLAADMISVAPQVAHRHHAPPPVCAGGCKDVRVCDDLIVSSAENTKVVAICYTAKY